ncbi:MAG: PD40 domain-containing protein, partial [Cytophagaceae bacterium]|nr:PD40 domain-containing protein [Gemmatimonadaceae bacterium]
MPRSILRLYPVALLLAIAGASSLTSSRAEAQYFGRNKVQYDKLDFRIMPTDHFRIHFYPAESVATVDAARLAERWYARHRALLKLEFTANPLIFYADPPDFQQSNVIEGEISQGTGGVTEGLRERVIMPYTGSYAETDHVLGHELVHVFQYRIAVTARGGLRSIGNVPLWLIEGMAEYLSLGRVDPNTAMWLRDALRRNDLPTLDQLTRDPRYFPYRYGQALWAYIGGRFGDDAVNRVFRASLNEGWEKGVASALGVSTDSLGRQWHDAIRAAYGDVVRERTAPDRVGRPVALAGGRGEQNISPAVSPDGKYVAYFSSRGLFGMDLYLADVETGRVLEQLTSVTTNSHFDQLSFLSSAGTWSPDGQKLAFVVYAQGDNEIDVMDVSSRRIERRIKVSGVGAMADPSWSPDGNVVAFTGYKGGLSDLYLHDLTTGQTRQVTNDREAQLQPSWSPDGKRLAFVTDAGPETDFTQMRFGEMRLGVFDLAAGAIQLLPRFGTGKHVNPQFTPDGTSILFVSDQDGVSDVYRLVLSSGEVRRVTRVSTGISGISGLSPAITVARNGTMLFSIFDQQGYSIRSLSAAETMGESVSAASQRVAGILPPSQGRAALVDESLEQVTEGLPSLAPIGTVPYRSNLKLDYIGGPTVGISAGGGYGTGINGGIGLSFSDELGNRNLQAVVQAQGEIKDLGAQVFYLNRENRWNWGGQAYHMPLAGGFATFTNTTFDVNGQTVAGTIYRREIQRVFYDNAQGLLQYPLSTTRRFEFSAGAQRISFSRDVDSLYLVGDNVIREVRGSEPAGDALTFGTATAAYVGDYSFFGFVSPVAGGRYRFEVSPSIGTVNYTTALADFRRYLFAKPITLAFRGMHYGRYGPGAESDRLQPLFVGQPYLIRGYDPSSFDVNECEASDTSDCPTFDRLGGSRIGVANV